MHTSGRPRSARSARTPPSPGQSLSPAPARPPSPAPRPARTPSPAPSCAPAPAHHDRSPPAPASPQPGRSRPPRHPAAAAPAASPAARSAAGPPASSRCRYPYSQNVLLAAFGTPSPYYRTRRTFPSQPHPRSTTALSSALSYYYGGYARGYHECFASLIAWQIRYGPPQVG